MADEMRINGNAYSWASAYFKVNAERFYGIKSISYGDSRERAKVWGMGRHHRPRGETAGKYDTEPVTVTVEKDTARALRAELANQASDGASFGNVEFEVVVQYVEGDRSITDTIEQCTWSKTKSSLEEGPDALYEEIEFSCQAIRWNGLTLFDETEG